MFQHSLSFRIQQRQVVSLADSSENEDATRHPFTRCPLVTYMRDKHYRFDVPLGTVSEDDRWKGHCWNGQCLAADLLRSERTPRLRIHEGRYWKITAEPKPSFFSRFRSVVSNDNTTFDDSEKDKFMTGNLHFSLSDKIPGVDAIEMRLDVMAYIVYIPQGDSLKENLLVIDGAGRVQLNLTRGLYNSEEVIRAGFDAFARKEVKAWLARSEGGQKKVYKANKGMAKGLTGGAAVAAGGVASWALWNAYLAILTQSATLFSVLTVAFSSIGALPIIAGGALAGAIVGGAHGAHKAYKKERWYLKLSETSAPKKIFEKLRCMRAFKRCKNYHDESTKGYVLVPAGKPCPPNGFVLPANEVTQTHVPLGQRLLSQKNASHVISLSPNDLERSAHAALEASQIFGSERVRTFG